MSLDVQEETAFIERVPGGMRSLYIRGKVWARVQERAESLGSLGSLGDNLGVLYTESYFAARRWLALETSTIIRRYAKNVGGENAAKLAKAWQVR